MERKRKIFMRAGAIGNLVQAGIFVIIAVVLLSLINIVTHDYITNVLKQIGFVEVNDVLTRIGEDGDTLSLTSKNVETLTNILKNFMLQTAISFLVIAILNLIFNIFVLIHARNYTSKNWAIIVSLITSILAGNLVCMSFFIVALCLRDKKA